MARFVDKREITGDELVVGALGDPVVEDLVEDRGLVGGDEEAGGGLVDRGDGLGGGGVLAEAFEDSAFDFEDLGEGVVCGEKVSCLVRLAGFVLVFWGEWVWRAEEVDDELMVLENEGATDLVVVLEESEALGSESVWEAFFGEELEGAVGVDDVGGLDIADADGKTIPGEVSAPEFVGVEVHPLDGEFFVLEAWEVFRGFAWRVDGEDLLGDRVFVFEAGVSDGAFGDFEVTRDDVDELEGGESSFFDEDVDVLAFSGGLVEGDLLDLEVFAAVFERALDAWGVTGEVDGGVDGGVEGGELWLGGGGHGRGL